ncbi:DUF3040 domain-containing protein [Streptomyces sp. NPDC090493]|uniref:DUF3040 domain-containing protein n=1 Tax=Streptomyces sp. NPDC090493 TaxID=3365964 RepID=UPI0038127FCF
MEDRKDPDDVVLSTHERLVLWNIEAKLDSDQRLVRRMRRAGTRPWLPLSVAALTCTSLILLVIGILTSDLAVLGCFATLWPLALLLAFRLPRRPADTESRIRS